MNIIQGFLSDLGKLNVDGSADSYDEDDILRYMNEGRCLIASLNPRFYAENKTFKLGAGNHHKICGCDQIAEVIGQAANEVCDNIRSFKFPQKWGCETDDQFEFIITRMWLDSDKKHLNTNPPIPPNTDVYVMLSCIPEMEVITEDTDFEACRDAAALSQWVLYRGTMTEAEDASSLSAAGTYLNTFAQLTSTKLKVIQNELERRT